jgi:hypothetical protein
MNKIHHCIWSEALRAWTAVSELVRSRGKHARSSRAKVKKRKVVETLLVGASALVPIGVFGQCASSGGTVTTSTTSSCTVSTAGSTLAIASPATFTGWANFTGNNTTLNVDAGAAITGSSSVSGNPQPSAISVSGSAANWSLTNNGTLLIDNITWDVIGFRVGGTFTVNNAGLVQNNTNNTLSSAIETSGSTTTLTINNSGTISTAGGHSINLDAAGTATITNEATGVIRSTSFDGID